MEGGEGGKGGGCFHFQGQMPHAVPSLIETLASVHLMVEHEGSFFKIFGRRPREAEGGPGSTFFFLPSGSLLAA
jgi:hypothetical protein